MRRTEGTMSKRLLQSCGLVACLWAAGCGGPPPDAGEVESIAGDLSAASAAQFTGKLTVSATSVAVGTPIVVSESAINLTTGQLGPIIIGIYRVGFNVTAVTKPRTGICRIAGSATCNFVELASQETQTYQLTLVPTTAGTFTIKGWASSSYITGGNLEEVPVTVH
jgi:hypothetical protein